MKILATGTKGLTKVKDAQGSCRNLSKVLKLGGKYRLIFNITKEDNGERDILLAAVPGRKLDFNKLGKTFLRIDDFEQDPETLKLVDKSGIAPYARIARVIHQAECAYKKQQAKDDAKKEADALGQEIDNVALSAKLKEIELEYNGDRQAKPQAVYATVNPMIGGVVFEAATECLVVPVSGENDEPNWAEATVAAYPLSNKKAIALAELVNDPKFCGADDNFLEVSLSWKGKDNKEAGQNATLQGLSSDLRLAAQHPVSWEANKDMLNRISKTAEAIASKNMTMSSNTTAREVMELFRKYISGHKLILTHIDMEDETVANVAQDILDSGIVDEVKTVQEKLLALVSENKDKPSTGEEEVSAVEKLSEIEMEQMKSATTVGELTAAAGGDIDALTGGDGLDEI